jgi:predicted RNA binding protein YcfA (HicA-like mRNA interferase family)
MQGMAHRAILTVPVHGNRDLRIGTLKSILRTAGLTESDLVDD